MPAINQQFMITTAQTRFSAASRQFAKSRKRTRNRILKFIPPMCKAICEGHDMWRQQAYFSDVKIMAVSAIGGRLEGPALEPLILSRMPQSGLPKWAPKHSKAIAAAMGEAWKEYQGAFRVPGLPWYPPFAAFPAPMTPPMPNVPTPLISCSNNQQLVSTLALKQRIAGKFGPHGAMRAQLFESIAAGFEMAITMWLPVQMIMNVLGKGPVPTFAPPYVPVGPVVGGDIISIPGHLAV